MRKTITMALLCAVAFAQHYTKASGLELPDYRKWVYVRETGAVSASCKSRPESAKERISSCTSQEHPSYKF